MATEKNISDLIEITEASDDMVLLIESDTSTNKITKANLLKNIGGDTVVIDNLNSTSSDNALSANQGRVLDEKIESYNTLNTSIEILENIVGVDETVGDSNNLPEGDADVISAINRLDSEITEGLSLKANIKDVYDKETIDAKISNITTNGDFSNYYTKEQIDGMVEDELPVYSITEADKMLIINNEGNLEWASQPVGSLTEEQSEALNKIEYAVYVDDNTDVQTATVNDTTKVVEVVEKTINNFRIPSLVPMSYVDNPIITADMVTDYDECTGVADPFLIKENGVYYCFFELCTGNISTSKLGYAYSYDALSWTYGSQLSTLETRCAFPNVFKGEDGEWYMLPDTSSNIDVYHATSFPSIWEKKYTLINGKFSDTDMIKIGDTYYLFTMKTANNLICYYNTSGDWKNTSWVEHPQNPIVQGSGIRLAGNLVVNDDGSVIVPCQGTQSSQYGEKTTFYQFTNITTTSINVSDGVTAMTGSGGMWDGCAVHQISTLKCNNGNLYVVDGLVPNSAEVYSIGLYTDGIKQEAFSATLSGTLSSNTWSDLTLTKVIDTNYMISGFDIKIKSSGLYNITSQVGADKFRITKNGVPMVISYKGNCSKLLWLQKNDLIRIQAYNSNTTLDNTCTSYIDVIKLN